MRKLEGKKFSNLDDFKNKVLFIWNKFPKKYCEKFVSKFDDAIDLLVKICGRIKSKTHSSYGPYNLSEPFCSEEI